MDLEKSSKSSILKPKKPRNPLADLDFAESPTENNAPVITSRTSMRRVSFANSNFIKEFATDSERNTIWVTTYEETLSKSDNSSQSSDESHKGHVSHDSMNISSTKPFSYVRINNEVQINSIKNENLIMKIQDTVEHYSETAMVEPSINNDKKRESIDFNQYGGEDILTDSSLLDINNSGNKIIFETPVPLNFIGKAYQKQDNEYIERDMQCPNQITATNINKKFISNPYILVTPSDNDRDNKENTPSNMISNQAQCLSNQSKTNQNGALLTGNKLKTTSWNMPLTNSTDPLDVMIKTSNINENDYGARNQTIVTDEDMEFTQQLTTTSCNVTYKESLTNVTTNLKSDLLNKITSLSVNRTVVDDVTMEFTRQIPVESKKHTTVRNETASLDRSRVDFAMTAPTNCHTQITSNRNNKITEVTQSVNNYHYLSAQTETTDNSMEFTSGVFNLKHLNPQMSMVHNENQTVKFNEPRMDFTMINLANNENVELNLDGRNKNVHNYTKIHTDSTNNSMEFTAAAPNLKKIAQIPVPNQINIITQNDKNRLEFAMIHPTNNHNVQITSNGNNKNTEFTPSVDNYDYSKTPTESSDNSMEFTSAALNLKLLTPQVSMGNKENQTIKNDWRKMDFTMAKSSNDVNVMIQPLTEDIKNTEYMRAIHNNDSTDTRMENANNSMEFTSAALNFKKLTPQMSMVYKENTTMKNDGHKTDFNMENTTTDIIVKPTLNEDNKNIEFTQFAHNNYYPKTRTDSTNNSMEFTSAALNLKLLNPQVLTRNTENQSTKIEGHTIDFDMVNHTNNVDMEQTLNGDNKNTEFMRSIYYNNSQNTLPKSTDNSIEFTSAALDIKKLTAGMPMVINKNTTIKDNENLIEFSIVNAPNMETTKLTPNVEFSKQIDHENPRNYSRNKFYLSDSRNISTIAERICSPGEETMEFVLLEKACRKNPEFSINGPNTPKKYSIADVKTESSNTLKTPESSFYLNFTPIDETQHLINYKIDSSKQCKSDFSKILTDDFIPSFTNSNPALLDNAGNESHDTIEEVTNKLKRLSSENIENVVACKKKMPYVPSPENNISNLSQEAIVLLDHSVEDFYTEISMAAKELLTDITKNTVDDIDMETECVDRLNNERQDLFKEFMLDLAEYEKRIDEQRIRHKNLLKVTIQQFNEEIADITRPFKNVKLEKIRESLLSSGECSLDDPMELPISNIFSEINSNINIEKVLTLDEKIENSRQRCKQYWNILLVEKNKYKIRTLYNTICLIVQLKNETGMIDTIERSYNIKETSEPVALFVHRIFKEKLSQKYIQAAVGEQYDILTLLDYVHLNMGKVLNILNEFNKYEKCYGLEMDGNFRITFQIVILELRTTWIISVNMFNLENISENSVTAYAEYGTVNQTEIKRLAKNCPQGIQFLNVFINKLVCYIEDLKRKKSNK